ncbi:S8 family serine peptidase [Flagellimonas flava]|uniref:S8 family serine peptidase n=1 Tax=Flagellimonas flava TaxID=570519 RepID=UPI003D651A01
MVNGRSIMMVLSVSVLLYGCGTGGTSENPEITEQTGWQHLDLESDSIVGISLERAYSERVKPNGREVVVALIDSPLDIDHPDLKAQIWTNADEVPDNGQDDDGNGYVDDVHGWNFLGHGDGQTLRFSNYDYIRAIRRLEPRFGGIDSTEVEPKDSLEYRMYQKALKLRENDIPDIQGELDYYSGQLEVFNECTSLFEMAYDTKTGLFNGALLDTLQPSTERQKELLEQAKDYAYYGWYPSMMESFRYQGEMRKAVCGNIDAEPRSVIGDDMYDLTDIRGHHVVDAPKGWISHATQVAGIMAATRDNGTGIKGVSNNIRIMPLVIFPERGDETDKDLANAIRYAVDNGAQIINYSHGRYFVERPDFIWEALEYAEDHGVLVVTAAGNTPVDIDRPEDSPFPMDNPDNGEERLTNLLKVAASAKKLEWVKPSWASYGKRNVDLFAPGRHLLTTNSGKRPYFTIGGSSLACALTSGVAALLWSQYPDLDHQQIKTILMLSGTRIEQEVKMGEDIAVPFSELSRTGRILNAHDALLLGREASTLD